ncbi:uncharacterized protein LOC116429467 [Nomia melanderi]|uniref:uncharacterized protein LOC116429467 n=1 Tax=Nomia melanderi TaxID=2448451 RepID=UPI003FCD54B0
MGNYINKYFFHDTETEKEETKIQSPSTEEEIIEDNFHTPVIQKTLSIDPRSVTSGIDRTPIEVNSTPVGVNRNMMFSIPRHLQTKPYLETDLDKLILLSPKKSAPKIEDEELQYLDMENECKNMELTPTVNTSMNKKKVSPIDDERYNILGLDPRSPAADFDRTPMLKPKSMNLLKARLQESLHRRGSYDTDILYPRFSYCETLSEYNIPEIQALPDLTMCKVKPLLLVNEEDSDTLIDSDSSSHSATNEIDCGEKQVENENKDENKTISKPDNYNDINIKTNIKRKEVHITDSDTIKIWRDPLILDDPTESHSTELQTVEDKISQLSKQEVIITFDDDSIVKDTLSMKLSKCEINKKRVDVTKKKKKVFKVEDNILADEKKIYNCNKKSGNEPTKIRTPLGNRSNNGQIQTKLTTNSPQQAIRNKGIKPKVLQENMSPYKNYMAKYKLNGTEWDPDSTVII